MPLEDDIRDRIRQVARDRYGGNVTRMSESTGVDRSKLTRIVQNRSAKVDVKTAEKIIRAANISRDWLYAGIGSMEDELVLETSEVLVSVRLK